MHKFIITSLLTFLFATSAFADLPSITFEGKKITVEDTRASLIKKLGKPTNGDNASSWWNRSNYSISASYDQNGVKNFGLAQLNNKPSPTSINVNGQTIIIGKDTLKTAIQKLKKGCFNIVDEPYNNIYSFQVTSGDVNVVLNSEYTGNKTTSANKPIFGVDITSELLDASEGCNYG